MTADTHMRREIAEIPDAAARLLDADGPIAAAGRRLGELRPRFLTTVARGSSDHAASFLKYAVEISTGIPVASLAPFALVGAAMAQDAPSSEPTPITDVDVNGEIVFRNRTTDENPILSYDLEYFQRFEPVSVGEMLKRVPGVTFTSDVLAFDVASMRGLPP